MRFINIIWLKWRSLANKIAIFQARFILTIFYFLALSPLGIIFSYFRDPLKIKVKKRSTWISKDNQAETIEEMSKQY